VLRVNRRVVLPSIQRAKDYCYGLLRREENLEEQTRLSSEVDDGSVGLPQLHNFTFTAPHSPVRQLNIAEIPCQNCGGPVTVSLPFYGCVFCMDCALGVWSADSEYFKEGYWI